MLLPPMQSTSYKSFFRCKVESSRFIPSFRLSGLFEFPSREDPSPLLPQNPFPGPFFFRAADARSSPFSNQGRFSAEYSPQQLFTILDARIQKTQTYCIVLLV